MSKNHSFTWKDMNSLLNEYSDNDIAVLTELELCNNTAFLASDTKIQEWEMILRGKGVKKISIGKEILFKKWIGYKVKGWMPEFIFRRIGNLKSSGIIDWWDKIIAKHFAKVRTNNQHLDRKFDEFYNKQVTKHNEQKSTAFFLVFILVLKVGLLATLCCGFELTLYFGPQILQKFVKLSRNIVSGSQRYLERLFGIRKYDQFVFTR